MPISEPSVTLSIIPAQQLAGVSDQRALIVGQKLAAGTATSGELISDFPNDGSENTLFGKRSHMAGLIRKFKTENQVTDLDVIPLDDAGSAVKGTAVLAFTVGPASADATVYVTIGSAEDYRAEITVTALDTVTEIGDAVVTAFAAFTDAPFTLANAVGVVTATAENGGTLSNDWGIKFEGTIPAVTVTPTGWTGGATDPTLTGVLDVIDNIRYQTILWPSAYDISEIQTLLDARFNVANAVMDGVALQVKSDTLANVKSYVSTFNSQSIVVPDTKIVDGTFNKGPSTLEMPDVACAQMCAIRALRRQQDAVLTQYLTTVAPGDQFGGPELSSLPYFNTSLPNLPVASASDEFSQVDINELNNNGVATFGPNRAYNGTIFGEFVTTYLTDVAGNPDTSYKYLNTVDTASVIREFFFNNLKSRYAQSRLTAGDTVAGRDIANEASIRAFCNQLYDELAIQTLVQRSTAAKKDYNLNLSVAVNVAAGSVTINQAPLLVSQLRVIIGTIQINFGD